MKKLLLTFCLIVTAVVARAAKADPTPFTVIQPDGTKLTLVLHGDEHFSWTSTLDGVLVAKKDKGYYVAKIAPDGTLEATDLLAHNADVRTTAEIKTAKAQKKAFFFKNAARKVTAARRAIGIGQSSVPYFPHVGSPKVLTVLVDFSDNPFTVKDPKASFEQYLNGEGKPVSLGTNEQLNYGSVRQYFKDMSNGKFTPQFGIVGPYRMPKPLAYYGKDAGSSHDVNITELIKDACEAAKGQVDLKDYDSNGDKIIDLVYVVYAGYAQSMGGNLATDIWPKSSVSYGSIALDGYTIGRYGVSNELNANRTSPKKEGKVVKMINGIGLFCHEFSHTMGLPDFYPIATEAQIDNQGMEYWDLMDGGEYTNNGFSPTPYTPWEKEVMGWTSLRTLKDAATDVTLQPDEAWKIESDNSDEYLIVHNIQKKGWHTGIAKLGHGMLVYRVNYGKDKVNMYDRVNDTPGKPGMTIVPADGMLYSSYTAKTDEERKRYRTSHAGDPFPGKNNASELLEVQLNLSTLKKPLYNIKENTEAQTVTFDYLKKSDPTGISTVSTNGKATDDRIYTLDGRYVGTAPAALPKGIYIKGGKKFVK